MLAACTDDSKTSSPSNGASSLRGDAPRVTTGADPTAAASAINAFADDMFLHLTGIDDERTCGGLGSGEQNAGQHR